MNMLKIGANAKGGFTLPENEVQFRYAARATAHVDSWELIEGLAQPVGARLTGIRNVNTGEERYMLGYPVVAKTGMPYIRKMNDNFELSWAAGDNSQKLFTVPNLFADGKRHIVYTVHVKRIGDDGKLRPMELSKSTWTGQFHKRHEHQENIGIEIGHPQYLNPLAFVPKDVLLALMVSGKAIGLRTRAIKNTRAVVKKFVNDEIRVMNGLPYVKE
jgi:hypothetical protein